ncbi:MAG: hypothetical protein ACRD8W_29800 [Nitrososphaeraceae archaeon]
MYNNFKAWLDHMIARMNVEYEKNGWHNEESHKDSFSSLHQHIIVRMRKKEREELD